MPKGGPRPGSGRKPGSPNKKTAELQSKVAAEGITPLEYMLQVLRDPETNKMEKMDAAKAAAPYIHARLNAVDMTAKVQQDERTITDAELLAIAATSRQNTAEEEGYSGLSH